MDKEMHFALSHDGYPILLNNGHPTEAGLNHHDWLDRHSAAALTGLPYNELDLALATKLHAGETFYSRSSCFTFRNEADARAAGFSHRFDFEPAPEDGDDPGSQGWADKQEAGELLGGVAPNLVRRKTWGKVAHSIGPSGQLLFSIRDLRAFPAGSLGYRNSG